MTHLEAKAGQVSLSYLVVRWAWVGVGNPKLPFLTNAEGLVRKGLGEGDILSLHNCRYGG